MSLKWLAVAFGLVNDRIKAILIELHFRYYMPVTRPSYDKVCDTDLPRKSKRGGVLIFEPNSSSFHITEFSYMNFFP